MTGNPRAERFFFHFALVQVALVIAGFTSAALFLPEFAFPPAPFVIFHGLVTLGWYVLTATQASLIGRGQYGLHKTMGGASIILAITVVVTGFLVVTNAVANNPNFAIAGMDRLASTIFPTMDLIGFTFFYGMALALRTNGAAHKRLMVLAGVAMLSAATARLGLSIGLEPLPGILAIVLPAAIMVHDWRSRGRPHWASVLGLVIMLIGTPIRMVFGPSETYAALAGALYQ